MAALRRHLRLPWVAIAAIAGMLSVAVEATACTAKEASKATRSCCPARPVFDCCCESTSLGSADLSPATRSGEHGLSDSAAPCECRPGRPNDPAKEPESSAPERRTDQDRVEAFGLAFEARPAVAFVRIAPPADSPPDRPLYLLNSRLLN